MTDFLKLAAERFSCRNFSPNKVEEEKIDKIVECARLAPTAVNLQPWKVWIVRSDEALDKVGSTTRSNYGAPLAFVVGVDHEAAWVRRYDSKNGAEVDASIVGTHIMMEAADLGLGCTWVGSFDPKVLKEVLPELGEWVPVAMFPVGHINGQPSPRHSERKGLDELVTRV